jgi:hypothetical protein
MRTQNRLLGATWQFRDGAGSSVLLGAVTLGLCAPADPSHIISTRR